MHSRDLLVKTIEFFLGKCCILERKLCFLFYCMQWKSKHAVPDRHEMFLFYNEAVLTFPVSSSKVPVLTHCFAVHADLTLTGLSAANTQGIISSRLEPECCLTGVRLGSVMYLTCDLLWNSTGESLLCLIKILKKLRLFVKFNPQHHCGDASMVHPWTNGNRTAIP